MSKRLQVLLDEEELEEIQEIARQILEEIERGYLQDRGPGSEP